MNPANPVIGVARVRRRTPRSSRATSRRSCAGLQSRRVAACAKHFPGHGVDGAGLAPRAADRRRATSSDGLEPFRAAIAAGVQSMMTAHVRVPRSGRRAGHAQPGRLTGLLRERARLRRHRDRGRARDEGGERDRRRARSPRCCALAAGVDALLIGHDLGDEAVRGRARARSSTRSRRELPEERLREAAARVARVAAWAAAQADGGARSRGSAHVAARRRRARRGRHRARAGAASSSSCGRREHRRR